MLRWTFLPALGLIIGLAGGCGSSSGGRQATGGSDSGGRGGNSGGAAGSQAGGGQGGPGSGGRGGRGGGGNGGGAGFNGTGGKTASGGNGGGAGAGGHVGSGGSTGGGGSLGKGGAGGANGYDCTGVSLDGDCSAYPAGLVCELPGGEAAMFCVCTPANGGPRWQCNGSSPCPLTPGTSGGCSVPTITTITNFGGCKYPPSTICSCEAVDGGAAWSCNNSACPAAPPTGSCAGSLAGGVNCRYGGTAIACDCATNGGVSRWRCNGQTTPDCPASWPGSGVDCSAFQPGTLCSFPAGNVTGGPCTCASNGTSLTWHCGNG